MLMPCEASAAGSARMRTARLRWPPTVTWATPEIADICLGEHVSASSSTAVERHVVGLYGADQDRLSRGIYLAVGRRASAGPAGAGRRPR